MLLNNLSLIDTHCHFDFFAFANPQIQLDKAKQACVERIVIPSIGQSNWKKVEQLAAQYPSLYYALGLHPYFMDEHKEDAILQLESHLAKAHSKCVAIGECGLDFSSAKPTMTDELILRQYKLFEAQLDLSYQYQKPVIIHSRKHTHAKIVSLLRQKQIQSGVIHGFSGSYQQAKAFVEQGFHIGVGGVITYPRANKTRQAIAKLPLDSLVLETDAPDMPLNGYQGRPNHPKRVYEVADCLAQLKNISLREVAQMTWENSNRLFQIDSK